MKASRSDNRLLYWNEPSGPLHWRRTERHFLSRWLSYSECVASSTVRNGACTDGDDRDPGKESSGGGHGLSTTFRWDPGRGPAMGFGRLGEGGAVTAGVLSRPEAARGPRMMVRTTDNWVSGQTELPGRVGRGHAHGAGVGVVADQVRWPSGRRTGSPSTPSRRD